MSRVGALLAAAALGCSDPAPDADAGLDAGGDGGVCLAAGAEVELGTGVDGSFAGYRPLGDRAEVVLSPGPQGGQHLWVALRARGIDPTLPRLALAAYRASDGEILGRIRIRLRMSPAPEDPTLLALPAQTLVFDDDKYCSVLPGDIRVVMDFDDLAGHCVHDERVLRVTGIDPTADPRDIRAREDCCTMRYPRCYPDAGAVPAVDASTR